MGENCFFTGMSVNRHKKNVNPSQKRNTVVPGYIELSYFELLDISSKQIFSPWGCCVKVSTGKSCICQAPISPVIPYIKLHAMPLHVAVLTAHPLPVFAYGNGSAVRPWVPADNANAVKPRHELNVGCVLEGSLWSLVLVIHATLLSCCEANL